MDFLTPDYLSALAQVILADLVMAGDNAIIVGLAAAGLPAELRKKAIMIGIVAATVLRIAFSAVTLQLLTIIGLTLAGGLLLLWVSWKLWREIRSGGAHAPNGDAAQKAEPKTFAQAIFQIVMADVSMSLDNVLAVAGAARGHMSVLAIGLVLSIALMALASGFIAKLLQKHHWIAYVGLAVIAYIAVVMIYDGSKEVLAAVG